MYNSLTLPKNDDIRSQTTIVKLILFVLWPFGAFLYALRTPTKYSSYLIFFLFTLLFSWSMYYDDYTRYIDFIAISERFYRIGELTYNEIWQCLINIFSEDAEYRDVYNLVLVSMLRPFTSNFHSQFVVAAIPFTLFMLGSLRYLTDDSKFRICLMGYLIMFLFLLPKDIFNIQNFRFSTATWMAVYGILVYFISHRKVGLVWIFLTPFVHSSFWLLVILLFSFIFCFAYTSILEY